MPQTKEPIEQRTMNMNLRSYLPGLLLASALFVGYSFRPQPAAPEQYAYRQFSTIESVVPGGLGRSRVIISDENDQTIEKDLLNFYSLTGINFKNVANNDRMIVETINSYTREGWELYTVVTGVNDSGSGQGGGGGTGIFITRYLFRRAI